MRSTVASALLVLGLAACGERDLSVLAEGQPAGLLSVTGRAADDVWVVGADKGAGPELLHYDGVGWERVPTGTRGDLWWAHALPDGPLLLAGANATVLSYDGEQFTRMRTPGPGRRTVFGLWAASEDEIWAVGGHAGRSGFAWRYDGVAWTELLLPLDIPRRFDGELPPLLKVWGDGEGTVWIVGGEGTILRSVDGGELEVVPSGTSARLFTVYGRGDEVYAVGDDGGRGVILEKPAGSDAFEDVSPAGAGLLQGLCVNADGHAVAAGAGGQVFTRRRGGWVEDRDAPEVAAATLHGVWIDPDGATWAVGGDVLTAALDAGVVLSNARDVAVVPAPEAPPEPGPATCPEGAVDLEPDGSIAQRWNEQLLNAVRRDIPRPGVHARNLFHSSIAAWDAWAAYDEVGVGVIVDEAHEAEDVLAAREEAISYAMHEVLVHRYAPAIGGDVSVACFDAFMEHLGYDPADDTTVGDSPRALGNRIGQAIVAHYADDGAYEQLDYQDPDTWTSPNPPITVDAAGYAPVDPSVWAPLNLAVAVTQNGLVVDAGLQGYIGPHWGGVEPWALERPAPGEPYFDEDGPLFEDPDMNTWILQVLTWTAQLDVSDDTEIDISPGAFGNNPLGTNDGVGHALNPATGQPYAPNLVRRSDFGRILAEFWADGPKSETPPGHWNTLANTASHHPDFERRLLGETEVDALEWDVKAYLALNGAVHDAAIAAWELKREHVSARPIGLIRAKASLGQSADPALPSYHPDGLPLVPGLLELITEQSAAPGERHQHLRHFVGEVAVWTWRGEPGDHISEVGGHGWERAKEWTPYQRRTFVTPAFPGFTSGHSTFSRSAARALHLLTGSAFFPGGLGSFTARQDQYLVFEEGPSTDVTLQWATWYDAADQAGQSRLWGGIHIWPDDRIGRVTGEIVGELAVERAQAYWDGTASSSAAAR